jgi:hypothetical protein
MAMESLRPFDDPWRAGWLTKGAGWARDRGGSRSRRPPRRRLPVRLPLMAESGRFPGRGRSDRTGRRGISSS